MIQKLNWTRSTKGLTVTDENGPALPIGKGGAIAPGGHSSCPSARFTDLDTAQWYHEYTDAMIEGGYMSGAGETFDPDGQLTRGMLVTMSGVRATRLLLPTMRFPARSWRRFCGAWRRRRD